MLYVFSVYIRNRGSETAEFLRLSTSTVYTLISKGELPHMKR
ncbi:MAG: helix-turn-helix domain-containing protein [Bacteroidetes bacterium]|nr:helix-turn-helix domain-containing protein [Bacteroidota bacterium]